MRYILPLFLRKLHRWLSPRQFLSLASVIVGLTAGGIAIALKTSVYFLHHLVATPTFLDNTVSTCLYPFVGLLLTLIFVQYWLGGKLERGLTGILYEIAQKGSVVKRHKTYSQVITSALTVGFGGSSGLEAPIVVTGSALGSTLAQALQLSYKDRTTLLGCGAAAGIAAVFNSPIAGVMFAIEILLAEVTTATFIPLVVAAVSGALCSKIVLQEDILFSFRHLEAFNYSNIPFYMLLAALSAGVSLFYAYAFQAVSAWFERFGDRVWLKFAIGGSILALLIAIFPSLFSEGYESIRLLADNQPQALIHGSIFAEWLDGNAALLLFIGVTVFIKAIATSVTLSAGGNGGSFAPSLFVGAHLGFFFSKLVNALGIHQLPLGNFTLVGMAGILSGVMYAPLTAIFLIAEITGGYDLIIPLMVVSVGSYAIVKHFQPYSMETRRLVQKGKIFTTDKDKNILILLNTSDLIETDIKTLLPTQTLGNLVQHIAHSSRNIFAVVDDTGALLGIITLDAVRELMFRTELYNTLSVAELYKPAPAAIHTNEDMNSVMQKFDATQAWNLPVIDEGRYIGFVSKSSIFSRYRKQLIRWSAE